jgi:four helix bundle protein
MPGYSFEDLDLYKTAREFRKKMFALIKRLPAEERHNLATQMRRAATSLTNNIAEGHGRYHYQENIQFLRQARGSLEELLDDLNICIDERYLTEAEIVTLKAEGYELLHKINSYIAYLCNRKSGTIEHLTN